MFCKTTKTWSPKITCILSCFDSASICFARQLFSVLSRMQAWARCMKILGCRVISKSKRIQSSTFGTSSAAGRMARLKLPSPSHLFSQFNHSTDSPYCFCHLLLLLQYLCSECEFCVFSSSGGQLAKAEELNTNIYIGEEVKSAGGGIKEYWIGKDTG